MNKFIPILLSSAIAFNTNLFPVEVFYGSDATKQITYYNAQNNTSYITLKGISTNIPINGQRKALSLDKHFTCEEFKKVTDIGDIIQDIRYNYYSNMEDTTTFINSLIWDGWEIQMYNADDITIYLELIKDEDILRIIIYDDYLKVYYKNDLFEEED